MSSISEATSWYSVTLDINECLNLKQILKVFSSAITEEHAWSIIYQTLVCFEAHLKSKSEDENLFSISRTEDVIIHSDGRIHEDTFKNRRRNVMKSENEVVADVGMVIYTALDFGVAEDEQRVLSEELESIINLMVSSDDEDEVQDEGLGDETDDCELIEMVLDLCRSHLAVSKQAATHYKAVCRALVAEAREISFFMTRLKDEDRTPDLDEVDMKEWASAWTQIMHQLRQGIKLKKVEYSKTATEFSLTPYEMLMDDIRSCKFKLNHVEHQVRVSSDARDKILEFIRSRPPLRPASERVLSPRKRKESTAREMILENIRHGDCRTSLRRIERRPSRNNVLEEMKKRRKHAVIKEESPILSDPDSSTIVRRRQSIHRKESQNKRSPILSPNATPKLRSQNTPKLRRKTIATNSISNSTSLSFLNLSLMELSHMRSEVTNADMEDKHLPPGLLSDVMEGRTCFVCLKINFGMIHWSYTCVICLKFVCSSCSSSININNDNYDQITVSTILPQLCSDSTTNLPSPGPTKLLRDSFHRLSIRSRTLVRSNTMNKEDLEKVKEMNLAKKANTSTSPLAKESRTPQMFRSNTTLDGSIRPLNIRKSSIIARSKVVCSSCRDMMCAKMREMKRGESMEHRRSFVL